VPTVHRERGFEFFFYSNENNEPLHMHVLSGDGYAKIWLGPPVVLAESHGYGPRQMRLIMEIATEQREMMERKWHEHFRT
jgi:hypothetical protein